MVDEGEINCMACGVANPIGLGLAFEREDGWVRADFTALSWHQGYDGLIHGGIIAILLDEAMAHAVLSRGLRAVTARLTVRFRTPLSVGQAVSVYGRVTSERGRYVEATARVITGETVIANAEALFALMRGGG